MEEMSGIEKLFQLIQHGGFTITFGEATLLLLLISGAVLYRQFKIGLLICYFFLIYWGYVANLDYFHSLFGPMSTGIILYYLVGVLLVMIAIIGFVGDVKD